MARRTRAQRAARIREIEGVPDEECIAEMGYESTDCDCGICDQEGQGGNA